MNRWDKNALAKTPCDKLQECKQLDFISRLQAMQTSWTYLSCSGKADLPLTYFYQGSPASTTTVKMSPSPTQLLSTVLCPGRSNLHFPPEQKQPGAWRMGLRKTCHHTSVIRLIYYCERYKMLTINFWLWRFSCTLKYFVCVSLVQLCFLFWNTNWRWPKTNFKDQNVRY